jgi:phosphonate degradation associated HDIG domain protein
MPLTVDEIDRLLRVRGDQQYGREAVSQLEHALQCAHLAEQAGETPHTVAAALLHDLGHLLAAEREHRDDDDLQRDDLHQYVAIPFLRGLLPDAVLEPIGLHVDAKRCLCCTEAGYWGTLSSASKRSLELQGGAMLFAQAQAFMARPFAEEALRMRRYDDRAKVPGLPTPPLDHYLALLADVSLVSDRSLQTRLVSGGSGMQLR